MNWLEKWFLRRIFARQVIQGPCHAKNITRLYSMIREAARGEFCEDSDLALSAFLQERFEESKNE